MDAFKEFQQQYQTISTQFAQLQDVSKDLYSKQTNIQKSVADALKTFKNIKGLSPSEMEQLQKQKKELEQYKQKVLNPGGKFVSMFLGSVQSIVLVGSEKRRYLFKEEYEQFKLRYTKFIIPLAMLCLFVFSNRAIDTLYQIFLTYYYMTLALRENILKVNGSHINPWWINHHYLSIVTTLTMVTWPQTGIYTQFRTLWLIFAIYSGIVQYIQNKYQMTRLYALKALGKANQMDTAATESISLIFSKEFAFLLPLIFIGHGMQVVMGSFLVYNGFHQPNVEWQVWVVALEFFCLAAGNIYTTIIIIKNKLLKKNANKLAAAQPSNNNNTVKDE